MAIIGVGIDIVDIERFKKILSKETGADFIQRFFSENEIRYCEKFSEKNQHYAVRFAAKEAFIKASGLVNLALKEISTVNLPGGQPQIEMTPRLCSAFCAHPEFKIHLSLTHTDLSAAAVVILESLPV